jgi:GTP-binding protein
MHKVLIVGRPNVGKSTLFNRLAGKRLALVHNAPGVTRDWRESTISWNGLRFSLIDTAGFDQDALDDISSLAWEQTRDLLQTCTVILFVVDARAGLNPHDIEYAQEVRRHGLRRGAKVLLIANKAEGNMSKGLETEFARLGFGEPLFVSAEHGENTLDIFYTLSNHIPTSPEAPTSDGANPEDAPLELAIVGRPNVGKSTLVNCLLGAERMLTADMPGVTRDALRIDWEYEGRRIRLVDTAGIRRRTRVTEDIEKLSVQDGLNAIQYAQVVVLVLDHETPLAKQEAILANRVIEEGRVLLIAINKWDLVKDKNRFLENLKHRIKHELPQVKGIPCLPISAKHNKNINHLMTQVFRSFDIWNCRIPTGTLNRWLQEMVSYHPPPLAGRSRLKIKYMTQIKTRPPTFKLYVNKPEDFPGSYERYLQKGLRESFDLPGVPIRITLNKSANPYAK